jgi:hypothetical protein
MLQSRRSCTFVHHPVVAPDETVVPDDTVAPDETVAPDDTAAPVRRSIDSLTSPRPRTRAGVDSRPPVSQA